MSYKAIACSHCSKIHQHWDPEAPHTLDNALDFITEHEQRCTSNPLNKEITRLRRIIKAHEEAEMERAEIGEWAEDWPEGMG